MNYSLYQLNIFDAVQNKQCNICVQATAGAGKTTTLLAILNYIPKFKRTIFLSFSNTIVNELKSRVPAHVAAMTLHSLGCRMIFARYKGIKVDQDKWFKIFLFSFEEELRKKKKTLRMCYEMNDIMNYARMTLTRFDIESLSAMCEYYSLNYDDEMLKIVMRLNEENQSQTLRTIDFTDMIYLPVKLNLIDFQYDNVLLDEAQDLNNAQKLFVEKILKPGGRLIAVGDENQSIYSFSGASIDSFHKLQQRPNTVTLPLSISYRCGKNIVREAQKIFPTAIEYFEGSIDGEVREGYIEEIRDNDLVVCRKTAPLVSVFFKLLSYGIKAQIIGKDVESGLLSVAEKIQSTTISNVREKVCILVDALIKDLLAKNINKVGNHPRYIDLYDKIQVITVILSNIEDPSRLVDSIKRIFDDNKNGVRLMTIHRSKGLEADRVFIIDKYNGEVQCPSPKAKKSWEKIQENNLAFVAITRAKKQLIKLNVKEEKILNNLDIFPTLAAEYQ